MSYVHDLAAFTLRWLGIGYYRHFRDIYRKNHCIGPFVSLERAYQYKPADVRGVIATRFHWHRPFNAKRPPKAYRR